MCTTDRRCPVQQQPGPEVYRTSSWVVGGCTFCSRHISAWGENLHAVTVIQGRGIGGGFQARACDQCLEDIKKVKTSGYVPRPR